MQFKSILAVLSLALAATAVPLEGGSAVNLVERTGTTNTCSPTQSAVFCTKKTSTTSSGASGGLLGLDVTAILKLLPILNNLLSCTTILGGNPANACCDSNNIQQNGLVNLGATCIAI